MEKSNKNKLDKDNLKKLKLIYLRNLGEKYCVSGEIDEPDENNKCIKCNINLNDRKYKNDELFKMEEILKELNETFLSNFNKIKKEKKNMIVK